MFPRPTPVIERGDHGLAGARRRNDKVFVARLQVALCLNFVEYLLLERVRAKIKVRDPIVGAGLAPALLSQGSLKPLAIPWLVPLELRVVPISFEGSRCLLPQVRLL